jgi:FkbM family methyltransferase
VDARRALWTAFRNRRIRRPVTVTWYEGLRVRLFLGNDLSRCIYVPGSFEPNEFVLLSRVLEPGMVFVDGGANDGLYSLFAARRVGSTGRVLAVEPSSREYERLLDNLRLNGIENTTAARAALGASRDTVELAIAPEGHEGQNTVGPSVANANLETAGHETVEMTTLDDLVLRHGLDRVDVIKLDIEGGEAGALEGARTVLERDRPLLLVEAEDERLASQGRTKAELLDAIAGLGYVLYVFDETTAQLRPPRLPDEPEGNVVAARPDWRPPLV